MRNDATTAGASEQTHAGASARVLAYLIDSVVLFCFSMVFAVAAALVLFLDSDQGRNDITDAEAWAFTAISAATVLAWLVTGVLMHLKRGQTVGQYVTGLRVRNEDGVCSGGSTAAAVLAGAASAAVPPAVLRYLAPGRLRRNLAGGERRAVRRWAYAMGLLSLVAPLVGLVYMLSDAERRTIHDRLAGMPHAAPAVNNPLTGLLVAVMMALLLFSFSGLPGHG